MKRGNNMVAKQIAINGKTVDIAGADGFSPTISTAQIDGGTRLTITDVEGTKTVDVMNGRDGTDGKDGVTPDTSTFVQSTAIRNIVALDSEDAYNSLGSKSSTTLYVIKE